MSQQEFASVVIDSRILTVDEVGDMMKHFSDLSATSLPFSQAPRIPRMDASIIHRCQGFRRSDAGWIRWHTSREWLNFSVNKPIMLHGIQHFGSKGRSYTVSTEVKDTTDGSSLVKQSGSYASEIDKTCSYYGFSVLFDGPVCLVENKKYKLESLVEGPNSWYGIKGLTSVESEGVVFTFCQTSGQIPVLFWSARR